jgi:hypothetical protein
MGTLQLTFHGPFLYRFTPSQVELYAPKCPGHTAALFTAKNEVPLCGRHRLGHSKRYRLAGSVFVPRDPQAPVRFYDPHDTILDASRAAKPALHLSHFCLITPVPHTVVPLVPNDVEVIDNSSLPPGTPTGVLRSLATGLRFYYEADLAKQLMLTLDGSTAPAWMSDFDAPALACDFADAEIRYTSRTPEVEEHQDALDCFDRIAALAGVDWWLSFEDPSNPHGVAPVVKNGADCRAAILTIR